MSIESRVNRFHPIKKRPFFFSFFFHYFKSDAVLLRRSSSWSNESPESSCTPDRLYRRHFPTRLIPVMRNSKVSARDRASYPRKLFYGVAASFRELEWPVEGGRPRNCIWNCNTSLYPFFLPSSFFPFSFFYGSWEIRDFSFVSAWISSSFRIYVHIYMYIYIYM